MVLRTDAKNSLDDVILQVFETEDDTFFFPVTSQKSARAFVKALHIRGIDYSALCREIDEFEHNFTSWRTGLGRPGIGNRVIERINRPVHELLLQLAEDEEEDRKTFTQLEKSAAVTSSEDVPDGLVCLGRVRFEAGPSPMPAGNGSPVRGKRPVAAKNLLIQDGKDAASDESLTPIEVETCAEKNHNSAEEKGLLEKGVEDRIAGTPQADSVAKVNENPQTHKVDSPSYSKSGKDGVNSFGEMRNSVEQLLPLVKADQEERTLERKSSEVSGTEDLVAAEKKVDSTKVHVDPAACRTAAEIVTPPVENNAIGVQDTKDEGDVKIHTESVEKLTTTHKLQAEVVTSEDKSPSGKVAEKVVEKTESHEMKSANGSVSGGDVIDGANNVPDVVSGKKADVKADVTAVLEKSPSDLVSTTKNISTANKEVLSTSVKTKTTGGKPENGNSTAEDVKLSLARTSSSGGTDVSAENRQMTVNHVTRRSPRRIRMRNTESDEEKDVINATSDGKPKTTEIHGKPKTTEIPSITAPRMEPSTEEKDLHFQQLQQGKLHEDTITAPDVKKENAHSAETNTAKDGKSNANNVTAKNGSKQMLDSNGSIKTEMDGVSNRNSARETSDDDDDVVGENYESDQELESQFRNFRKSRSPADGPGYVYAFTDSRNDATDFRMKIAASRNPCGRLEQAKRFNVDIRLVSAIQVSARVAAAGAIHDRLKDLALTGSVDWFVGELDNVIGAMMDVGQLYPVES